MVSKQSRSRCSVQIESECADSHKEVLLDDCDGGQIIGVLVPELASAHADALPLIFAHNHLNEVLVALIFVQTAHLLFGVLCDLSHKRADVLIVGDCCQAFLHNFLDCSACLLNSLR